MKQGMSVVAALCLAFPAFAQEELAAVARPAPMFRLPVYNAAAVGSGVVGLERYVGPEAPDKAVKVVLLSFMASFCGPCKQELPSLQRLHERYNAQGLRVVMISVDAEPEGQKKMEELILANKVTFPVLKDRFNLVARRWLGSQSPLPSVFLIKPDGVVSLVHRGYNEDAGALFVHEVEAVLGVKPGSPAASAPSGGGR